MDESIAMGMNGIIELHSYNPFILPMPNKQTFKTRIKRIWKIIGPGLVTGASDDDPSGIATYSQAGAAFGLATLWTSILAFPLMAAIQQMCARIGLVTNQGLTGTLKKTLS